MAGTSQSTPLDSTATQNERPSKVNTPTQMSASPSSNASTIPTQAVSLVYDGATGSHVVNSSSRDGAADRNSSSPNTVKNPNKTPSDPKKHKPITPNGTVLLWKDNPHIQRQNPFRLGEENKKELELHLKAASGTIYVYDWTHRDDQKWHDKKWLAEAQKWRKQVLDRTLDKPRAGVDNPTYRRTRRPHWSEREQLSIHGLIRFRIRQKRRHLIAEDWAKITQMHNNAFVGKQIRCGERTPASKDNKGRFIKSGRVKSAHFLNARTIMAVRNQIKHWPMTEKMMLDEYSRLNHAQDTPSNTVQDELAPLSDSEEDTEEQDVTMLGADSDISSDEDESEHSLEDESDDEQVGQKLAGHSVGGVVVSAKS